MRVNTDYVSGRCSTDDANARHAEYQIINLILGNITTHQAMSSDAPVDRGLVDGLAIRRPSILHTCSFDSSPVSVRANPYG
ncbi:hypothetical protein TNCV_1939891 [Trichonephila clavipes]|nr:hypothetical protein TNCV_1939891 [Trichonephila clavipes]